LLNGVAVVLMSIGLVIFNMADLSVEPNLNKTGKAVYRSCHNTVTVVCVGKIIKTI